MTGEQRIAARYITSRAGMDIVVGWESVAAIIGCSVRTAQRMGIPVIRRGRRRQVWIALADLLRWAQKNDLM